MTAAYALAMQRLDDVLDAPVPTRAPTKEHLLLKAAIVATDNGTFTAVISSEAIDREQDIVRCFAMVDALQAWTPSDKRIPLLWSHSPAAEDLVGHIRPDSVKAVDNEVVAEGWIDQATDRGKEAWRVIKSRTAGFSFGYIVNDMVQRADRIREIIALDVYEVSLCSTPMQHNTRVLDWKSTDRAILSLDELHELEADVMRVTDEPEDQVISLAELRTLEARLGLHESAELRKTHDQARDMLYTVMAGSGARALRARAESTTREHERMLSAARFAF
jgi:HK97 family phage prohead protease